MVESANILFTALFCAGLLVTGYWSYQAFVRRQIEVEAVLTPPRYMTRKPLFFYGLTGFVALSLCIYSLIVFFFRDLVPLLKYVNESLHREIKATMDSGDLAFPMIIAFSAAAFVLLLKVEHRLNVVLIARDIIHNWTAIPRKTRDLMNRARESQEVPEEARAAVVADTRTRFVAIDDFTKERGTLDRRWAESCYMIHWLREQESAGGNGTFFSEPALMWARTSELLDGAIVQLEPLKSGSADVPPESINLAYKKVEELQRHLCRLVACFLIYKNGREVDLWKQARHFGIPHTPRRVPNLLGYTLFFIIGVMIAVYVGCLVAATFYDVVKGASLLQAFQDNFSGEIVYRWIGYGVMVWCPSIFVALLGRYLHDLMNLREPGVNLISYAGFFVIGVAVSTLSLTATVLLMKPASMAPLELEFWPLIFKHLRWAIGPGIICAYLGFRMDTMRLDHEPLRIRQRLAWVGGCVGLMTLLVLGPAFSIPKAIEPWDLTKTRLVVLATTVMIGLTLAAIAEFTSIKSEQKARSAEHRPGSRRMALPGLRPLRARLSSARAARRQSLASTACSPKAMHGATR